MAVQGGFQAKMEPGNKIIQDGRNTVTQGATLFAQGEKTFTDNLNNPDGAEKGLKMMVDAFKITGDGGKMLDKMVLMNNNVARDAGASEKFAQGNQVIETSMNTMAQGTKLFLQGETMVVKKK